MNFSITSCLLVSASLLALSACGKEAKDAVGKVTNNLENAELIHTWERDIVLLLQLLEHLIEFNTSSQGVM